MIDMSGERYGNLTVVSFHHFDSKRNSYWLCKCDCGKNTIVRRSHLLSGGVSSCGCQKPIKCGNASRKHGMWGANRRLYKIWTCMIRRGTGKTHRKDYFERGITVCDEWKTVNSFFDWALSNGYRSDLEIDRIDNDKGYYPENCRWVTRLEQMNNTRKTRRVVICGREFNLRKLRTQYGISDCMFNKSVFSDMPDKERFLFLLCCKEGNEWT